VLAIYARETGQGMALPEDVLTGNEAEVTVEEEADEANTSPLSIVPNEAAPDDDNDPPTPSPRRGGHLRIVK
jgi:stringent starvation protein B